MPNIFESFADELDKSIETLSFSPTQKCPNKFPSLTHTPYKIAIIGEAPGENEILQGQPFVGQSGKLLTGLLSKAQILREACFIGNICQHRPYENKIENFDFNGPEINQGLEQLSQELSKFQPNVCLLLGKTALRCASGKEQIGDYRGSIFVSDVVGPFLGRKCIASYHPAAVLRQYDWIAYLWFDILKCLEAAKSPTFTPPERKLEINLSANEIVERLFNLNSPCSVDIEGGLSNLPCCSFSTHPSEAFIVPFQNLDGTAYWENIDDEVAVWSAFAEALASYKFPKVFQNGLYDRFVLQYGYDVLCLNNTDDTMLQWWEKFCELEKGLGVQASILTTEPYYKFERKSTTKEDFYRYCCKDSAVTLEINQKLKGKLTPEQEKHYRLNVSLLNAILYMELRGIKYNKTLAEERLQIVNHQIYTHQAKLDAIAGVGCGVSELGQHTIAESIFTQFGETEINKNSKEVLKQRVQETCCYKRDPETPKKEFAQDYYKILLILKDQKPLTQEEIGFINLSCGWSMNTKSKNFKTFLYEKLKLPKQVDPKTGSTTSDYEALLKLSKKNPHAAITLALEIGKLRTRSQMLGIASDKDGRIRCGYNIVGTETGRLTCYTSPTGSGYNLQTVPDDNALKPEGHPLHLGMRDLFIADKGYHFFQCDLSGADGWTVGAHLAALGDPTMLDDLKFGIKPAARICYMLRHGNYSLRGKERPEVKELLKEVKKTDWDYFGCKQGIWGTCYLMGPLKLSDIIFIQSEGKVHFSLSQSRDFQTAVFASYDVRRWHRWMERKLAQKPELVSASGHRRRFWGRSREILGQALANEPQENTTYSVKLALYKLWTDRENRIGNKLIIEPLHTVHDSLNGQFPVSKTEWAVPRIREYFQNEILIAGQRISIPFEGQFGESWGNLETGKI